MNKIHKFRPIIKWKFGPDFGGHYIMVPTYTVIASCGSSSESLAILKLLIPRSNARLARFFTGLISEVIVYNRRIPNSDIQAIKTYLIRKYNLKNEYFSNLNA
ncbi:MAG: hypothetical protein FJ368_06360 [Pelagibacterales bacterium]|nr:hypothetical protein [Pelagibacterales bacterium]